MWVGGGGGGAHERLRHLKSREPQVRERRVGGGLGGILPQEIFKKIGYLRQHFVRFEDSLLGNKPGKSKGH